MTMIESCHVHLGEVELLDGHLARLREGEVPQQHRGAERQRVHVLRPHGVHLPRLGQLGALRLCLSDNCLLY